MRSVFFHGKLRVIKRCLVIWASVFLCALTPSGVLRAQGDVSVSSYSISEGLTGNGITAIFQDSKGFLWVGTQDGLNMYDGYSFKVYRHKLEDGNSISGNYIQCINEDAEGNLWIGTIGNGLNKWNRDSEKFIRYNSKLENECELPEDNVYGLSFDTDSALWVKTDNYLLKLDYHPFSKSTYGLYSSIFKYQEKLNVPIFYKNPHLLWIGTKDGIAQFNSQEGLYERFIVDPEEGIYSNQLGAITGILELDSNSYALSGLQGLYHLRQKQDGSYVNRKIKTLSEKENAVNCIFQHSSGIVWAGTKAGLRVVEYDEEYDVLRYDEDSFFNQKQNRITEDEVTFLFEDKSGLLWVGTRYSGLLKVDFKPKKFKRIRRGDCQYPDLNTFDIKSIYMDDEGLIWLGTADKGLKILDPQRGDVYSYPVNRALNSIGEDMVLALCRDSHARIWIGTAKGIYIFHLNSGIISEFSYADSRETESLLKENRINAIAEDALGNIWFGTQFGLYKYDGKTVYNFFAEEGSRNGICSDEVNALLLDSEGILWIGTSDGVNFLDSNEDVVKKMGHFRNSGDSISVLSNHYILSIAEDHEDGIWFGTRSGLSYYNKREDVSKFYTHSSGIANDMIYGVICDKNSGVWISTNKGISFIKDNEQIYNFDIADGLPGYVFSRGAVEQSSSGIAYFGGVEGVAFIDPDSITYNLHRPEVVFTSIELYHKGKVIDNFKVDTQKIRLKYRKSSMLKVSFAALEFSESGKNKYQVYLEGFDDDWRPVTSENMIGISDLPAGDYTLHVKGANSDHIWTEKPVTIDISVIPPIWMSNYAYAFYLIALVFMIQSIINYRIRNYKTAYKTLEEKAGDKKKIEAQRELLSKINQSLTDSIYYAKRIQESILPSEAEIKKILPESFVYYRPKDLVSGDFYWKHEMDGKIFIAAVDCTGHGVPGAFMSIIAYDMLKRIIRSNIEYCPAYILERLNKEVIDTFKKNNKAEKNSLLRVNDGMDIALCIIDKKQRKMTFAGAFNPLYLIRDNEILVFKGDRFPIGYQGEKEMKFSKHNITLEENDIFYIFSDGYADQFGGEEGKKFKYRRFRHLLLNIHRLPAEDQKAILHQKIEEWMGDFEQVDDIIVMGIKPLKESSY